MGVPARYQHLLTSICEGFCILERVEAADGATVDFRIIEANPSFEAQLGLAGGIGRTLREVVPSEATAWIRTYDAVLTTGVSARFNRELPTKGRKLELHAFRIDDAAQRSVGLILTELTGRQDVDALLRASEERYRRLSESAKAQAAALAALQRRKDEFLAVLSHELRAPLAPIANAVEILQLREKEGLVERQACLVIERQVNQLKHLIDDLLEVSRFTNDKVHLREQRVPIGAIVDLALEAVQPLIDWRRHELTVTMPAAPIWLNADAARLEQVVVNLLTNAAKYTDEGGHIWVTLEQEGETAVLSVRDNGIGITTELLPNVFDLFTQEARSLDRAQGGLGIGLSLVRRLVELHHGTVAAISAPGQGSEFIVRLPVGCAPASTPVPPTPTAAAPGAGCAVLVVDDSVDTAEILAMLLTGAGHRARTAHDGAAALAAIALERPDAVLMDIGLPGIDGFEVARRIRRETGREITLVAMTGYGQERDRQLARDAGFDHHLVKPASFDEVIAILAAVPVHR